MGIFDRDGFSEELPPERSAEEQEIRDLKQSHWDRPDARAAELLRLRLTEAGQMFDAQVAALPTDALDLDAKLQRDALDRRLRQFWEHLREANACLTDGKLPTGETATVERNGRTTEHRMVTRILPHVWNQHWSSLIDALVDLVEAHAEQSGNVRGNRAPLLREWYDRLTTDPYAERIEEATAALRRIGEQHGFSIEQSSRAPFDMVWENLRRAPHPRTSEEMERRIAEATTAMERVASGERQRVTEIADRDARERHAHEAADAQRAAREEEMAPRRFAAAEQAMAYMPVFRDIPPVTHAELMRPEGYAVLEQYILGNIFDWVDDNAPFPEELGRLRAQVVDAAPAADGVVEVLAYYDGPTRRRHDRPRFCVRWRPLRSGERPPKAHGRKS